ncbi:hypothetical protein LTR16_003494 [Cryomyces antarcticus]|uniref:TAFII55 protein conserved region domain-containing protein n=1 Tax=Cryomyces antarcticus TaxID=329879 RepID=A0ABR0M6U0_9PEZI|nr:hypothetical protein LTR16_003494 [Cryomyces antarcticus]
MSTNGTSRPTMKLKLNTSATPAPAATPTPSSSGGLKLKLGARASQTPAPVVEAPPLFTDAPKPKRKYNRKNKGEAANGASLAAPAPAPAPKASKKRTANDDTISPAAKRQAKASDASIYDVPADDSYGYTAPAPAASTPRVSLKLNTKKLKPAPKPSTPFTPNLKLKTKGQPPPRPVGVGYDSEASDTEADPAIESQFVLRMQPGDDCDYLRQAIEDKMIGVSLAEGGADVSMKWLDREGRRCLVTIRGKAYAASLVDLPCVVEGMKSWDKRGWWKVADICQMLLVLGPAASEAEAKAHPLPREVDEATWQFAHGLTPPMHWARKRRFRKRVSYRTIEAVEEEVERLLARDEEAKLGKGSSTYEVLDLGRLRDGSEATAGEDESEDAEGEEYVDTVEDGNYGYEQDEVEEYDDVQEDEEDAEAIAAQMMHEFGGNDDDDDNDDVHHPTAGPSLLSSTGTATAPLRPIENPAAAAAAAASTLPAALSSAPISPAAATPSAQTPTSGGSASPSPSASDAEERAQQAAAQAEMADLEREVEAARARWLAQKNLLLKDKFRGKWMSLLRDLELKRGVVGAGEEGV